MLIPNQAFFYVDYFPMSSMQEQSWKKCEMSRSGKFSFQKCYKNAKCI